jgi:hypothetical protein
MHGVETVPYTGPDWLFLSDQPDIQKDYISAL